jgi:hypothetical protein
VDEGEEVGHRAVATAALGGPRAQRGEKVLVSDRYPQCVQRHRAAVIDRWLEHLVCAGVAGWNLPELVVVRVPGIGPRSALLRAVAAGVLVVKSLSVGSEAFIEPDVTPVRDRDTVPEPLVGQLMHH